MYTQYIVVDRKLNMTRGKLMAQAAHASMSFLTNKMRQDLCRDEKDNVIENYGYYYIDTVIDKELYDNWIDGNFSKVILAVDGKEDFYKVVESAKENGFVENRDFFIIRDACLTELEPEDESGTCATCIGFTPMEKEKLFPVVGNLPLFR